MGWGMTQQNGLNRQRIFTEVVTIDAWHQEFSSRGMQVDLHADVVFGEGRIGGEADSPVRFRLQIKRAQLVLVVPETEPVKIDKNSVWRTGIAEQGKQTKTIAEQTRNERSFNAGLGFKAGPSGIEGSVDVKASGQAQNTRDTQTKATIEQDYCAIDILCKPDGSGSYLWEFRGKDGAPLRNRPFDPIKNPLLRLIDIRSQGSNSLPPSVRLELRCRREDLVIEDIVVKDGSLFDNLKKLAGHDPKMRAAEAYIRTKLRELGLTVGEIADPYAKLTLASTTATVSQD